MSTARGNVRAIQQRGRCEIGRRSLSNEQRAHLHAELVTAYPSRNGLDRLLTYKLNRSLSGIASETTGLDDAIFAVVERAHRDLWMDELLSAVMDDRPQDDDLRKWVADLPDPPDFDGPLPAPPVAYQRMDPVFFDLSDLRRAVEKALGEAGNGPLAFGVGYPDLVFIAKVCDWLPYCLGPVQRKEPLNLKPEFAPVSRQIQQVVRYRADLDSANVLCPILADNVDLSVIEEFWAGVRGEFADLKNRLVLIIAANPDDPLPAGVVVLPAPRFDHFDVLVWAREIVGLRGWAPEVAELWSAHIIEQSVDGLSLDVRAVYEAMDRSIKQARTDPEGFRMRLEQRSHRAHTASC